MKNILVTILLFCPCILFGQSFTNDWIDYNKQYYKFKVYEDGIYRINYNALVDAGIPVSSISPQQFQIFYKGEEQYIYVEGTGPSDTIFSPGEFIEFYGERNTGWLDTAWYAFPDWHANPNVSIYTDTSTYFLTWENSGQTNRFGDEDDVDFTGYVPADYFLHESRQDYYSSYNQGGLESITPFTTGGYDSEFTEGEGWFRPAFDISTPLSTPTPGIYSLGPDAEAKYVLIGANNNNHDVDVTIGSGPANNHTYSGTKVNKLSYNIPLTYLGSVSTAFIFKPSGQYNTIGYISVKYAHSFDLGGASAYKMSVLDNQISTKSFLSIDNFTTSSPCWLFDLTNHKRIKTIISNGIVQALVPNSNGEKECFLSSETSISTITELKGVGSMGTAKFTDYTSIDPDSAYLIISNEKLYNDGSGYNYVNDYRNHRTSVAGGGYNVVLANIDELYDQFAYGVRKNPMAIRGFCNYTLQNWSTPPQHLLLIGKSIQSVSCRYNMTNYANNLVPSYGYPPSDNLLTAGLAGTTWEPAIATGRIAASSWEEVKKYLDKIIEFDANQTTNLATQIKSDQEWKKQIIHLAGAEGLENVAIKGYLKEFEQIIEDTSYGGNVHTFSKNSSEPIQNSISDLITDLINNGVSLITFFGHASGAGFDQDIDNPNAYSNNDGKYPFLLANSCYVGDIHQPTHIFSNSIDWTLHERGVIGFLASTLLGDSYELKVYTESLYRKLGQSMYGSSIGKCMISTISEIKQQTIRKNVCLQMTLHGDPAVVLNTHKLPDYTITSPDVYTNPQDISADLDSFDLNMIVTNIGMAVNEDLTLTVKRMYPPEANIAEDPIYYLYFSAPHYKDTLTLRLPVEIANGVGLNKLEIKIDANQYIDELSDINNDIPVYSLWIKPDDIRPVYPYEYAVIPEPATSLKASTGDPFAPIETYVFEIDTNDNFNPPLRTTSITQGGGVLIWDPADDPSLSSLLSSSDDSTVYFWRVRKDSNDISDSNHIWRETSFQYIAGKRGWGQAHFHQFKNNQYNLLEYDKPNRKFEFVTTPKQLWCKTIGAASGDDEWNATEYKIDGSSQVSGGCGSNSQVIVAVIDPTTLVPWSSELFDYGQINFVPSGACGSWPHDAFIFRTSTQLAGVEALLLDVPDSHYVLAYSFNHGNTDLWDTTLINTFASLGWGDISSVGNKIPFIFFTKKGDLSSVVQSIGTSETETITLTAEMKTNWDFGYMTSTHVGPTANWNSLHWKVKALEPTDSVILEVIGTNSNGSETVITSLQNLTPDSANISNLSSKIDANTYPKLKLRVYKEDDSLRTAAQLNSWHVLLDEVPEAVINASKFLSFYKDTLQEGDIMNLSTVIENISEFDMDSLLVSFWVIDQARNIHYIPEIRYKPLLQSPDTILTAETFSTKDFVGLNSIWVEVNPLDTTLGTFDQLEKYHFNNLANKSFYVIGDDANPMLDVTFDGAHILDGDIVSAEPQIAIELRDENRYLALDTNSLLQVYIKNPEESDFTLIPYDNNLLTFVPANLPENKASIRYNPVFANDGVYELRIQATDISNNESGDNDYIISFEIIQKPSVTSVMNWPNPFSTSTKFVFTLTGTDVPQDFRIRIMTISGRVVREIFAYELGPLHIGRNITEFAWDGTDKYGDRLANGIYLYKVDIRLDGNTMETRETNADQYFHKGYGKMYLMR